MKEKSQQSQETHLQLISDFLQRNPGFMLSIGYLLLTLCGIFYSAAFYAKFEIDILKLADISEFLLVGINEPAAILMFCGGLLVAYVFDRLSRYSYDVTKRWQDKPKSIKRTLILIFNHSPRTKSTVVLGFFLLFIIYAFVFVKLYALHRSDDVKQGGGERMMLQAEVAGSPLEVALLGKTANYLLVYDYAKDLARIISNEQVQQLTPVLKPQEEPEAVESVESEQSETP